MFGSTRTRFAPAGAVKVCPGAIVLVEEGNGMPVSRLKKRGSCGQAEVERQGRVDLPVVLPEEGDLLVREEGRRAGLAAADEGRVVAEQRVGRAGAGVLRPYRDAAEISGEEPARARAVLVLTLDVSG